MTTTRTRKPKTRTCRLEGSTLVLTIGGIESRYELLPLSWKVGSWFRLVGEHAGQVYDVDTDRQTCTCDAAKYGRNCKHRESLQALVAMGRI